MNRVTRLLQQRSTLAFVVGSHPLLALQRRNDDDLPEFLLLHQWTSRSAAAQYGLRIAFRSSLPAAVFGISRQNSTLLGTSRRRAGLAMANHSILT